MKGLYALSFIVTSTLFFNLGYRMGQYRSIKNEPPEVKPIEVKLNFFQYVKEVDNWFFPCNVIHLEIIERDETDEFFYSEMCGFIKKFIKERKNSGLTFIEYSN